MRSSAGLSSLLVVSIAIVSTGCASEESAMMCVEQSPASTSVAVSNRCNETIVVSANDGEKLIIAAGLTHHLLGAGKQLGACFAPKEPRFVKKSFYCE